FSAERPIKLLRSDQLRGLRLHKIGDTLRRRPRITMPDERIAQLALRVRMEIIQLGRLARQRRSIVAIQAQSGDRARMPRELALDQVASALQVVVLGPDFRPPGIEL